MFFFLVNFCAFCCAFIFIYCLSNMNIRTVVRKLGHGRVYQISARSYSSLNPNNFPSGSKWTQDELDTLKIESKYEPELNNILPCTLVKFQNFNQRLKTTTLTTVYNQNPDPSHQYLTNHLDSLVRVLGVNANKSYTTEFVNLLLLFFNLNADEYQYPLYVVHY